MRRSISAIFAFLVGFSLCRDIAVLAQQSAQPQSVPAKNGVWFQVSAAIKPPPNVQGEGGGKSGPRASVSIQLRISSHAVGSNYYGYPKQSFDFKLSEGSAEKIYWQDATCHPRRGLPKVSVVAIDGSLERDGKTIDIKARPRHIGLKLPEDELSPGSPLERGSSEKHRFLAFQASTKASKLAVIVKIYTADCAIDQARR
jgi:hypothetical protein